MLSKVDYDRIETFEFAPGLVCTIRYEDNSLPEVIDKFLSHKTPISELRKATRVRGNPRCLAKLMSPRRVDDKYNDGGGIGIEER